MKKEKYIRVRYSAECDDKRISKYEFTLEGEVNDMIQEFLHDPYSSRLYKSFEKSIKECWKFKD